MTFLVARVDIDRQPRYLEVAMIVVAASRIELRAARGAARITLHVLENGKRCTASAAEYCLLVPFTFRPDCDRMIGERQVAVFAGIVDAAARHLDGNDVSRTVIVFASVLRIEIYSPHLQNSWIHLHRYGLGTGVQSYQTWARAHERIDNLPLCFTSESNRELSARAS